MPFSRMACGIQINVQLVGYKHTEKEEVTVENSEAQANGDSSQELAALFFIWPPNSSGDVCCWLCRGFLHGHEHIQIRSIGQAGGSSSKTLKNTLLAPFT